MMPPQREVGDCDVEGDAGGEYAGLLEGEVGRDSGSNGRGGDIAYKCAAVVVDQRDVRPGVLRLVQLVGWLVAELLPAVGGQTRPGKVRLPCDILVVFSKLAAHDA